ncbi:MAG TPA: phenylalanine--tRNA ligase subunit beta [Steroidobacteraceae bacterium]|jgi:phenylalanyl-tRNA synthetase beta chain|nr:phenylalanine--tRNA ligase subunit beta [Steroidobacteraceae bacterium]
MKVPISWLSEWVRVPWPAAELGARLTMAGLELEAVEAAAPAFSGVVVAQILQADPHPQADKLRVCRVTTGSGEPLQIVCGAPNARAGLRTALATLGAELPGGLKIGPAKLRGVESRGMLCSSKELGLGDSNAGILELPQDAPLGTALREYLQLDDTVLELNVTANRGDAMSIIGVAREVAALSEAALHSPAGASVGNVLSDQQSVRLEDAAACPKFVGRIIRGIDNTRPTPLWLRERLRRAGVRCISPAVDVTNYVLLELGQPMHAYDLAKVSGSIVARTAKAGEALRLLDGRDTTLDADMLVIADDAGAVGLAGIMGGERTAVSTATRDVFLEVAWFAPDSIRGRARRLGLHTDASQRFERGVDPSGQARAMERATELLIAIAGGRPGPLVITEEKARLPTRPAVTLRRERLTRLLGIAVPDGQVSNIFRNLQMQATPRPEGWSVVPPPHRFDISIEEDLIEEVARIMGFAAIPERPALRPQRFLPLPEASAPERALLEALVARGYHETISFAFVDPALQALLFPETETLALANAIASDLSVMRVSLWPGLVRAALENQRRQQDRIRLFEHGARFAVKGGKVTEVDSLAGIALGKRLPEQWGSGEARESEDFYDVKADLQSLLAATGAAVEFSFEAAALSCLHPGRSARVLRAGSPVGWIGELHPRLVRELGFNHVPVLFEVDVVALRVILPRGSEISRFPQVRRDLAVVLPEKVTFSALRERVILSGSSSLRNLRIFDVYRGAGIEEGRKSVALGLIFQDISRTLTDDEVERAVAAVVADLRENLDARIRE